MKHQADSVQSYLGAMPPERRPSIEALRALILANLPPGYVEAFNWGMISYEVPLEASGRTYNGKPLLYAALASQKNHMAVYLCGLNCTPRIKDAFEDAFRSAGKRLDMGQACLRFRKLGDLDLDSVAAAIAAVPVAEFVAAARRAHGKA